MRILVHTHQWQTGPTQLSQNKPQKIYFCVYIRDHRWKLTTSNNSLLTHLRFTVHPLVETGTVHSCFENTQITGKNDVSLLWDAWNIPMNGKIAKKIIKIFQTSNMTNTINFFQIYFISAILSPKNCIKGTFHSFFHRKKSARLFTPSNRASSPGRDMNIYVTSVVSRPFQCDMHSFTA